MNESQLMFGPEQNILGSVEGHGISKGLKQVQKCFGLIQMFCAGPKTFLHIVPVPNFCARPKDQADCKSSNSSVDLKRNMKINLK